jgi:hypothetical protein
MAVANGFQYSPGHDELGDALCIAPARRPETHTHIRKWAAMEEHFDAIVNFVIDNNCS